MKEKEEMPLELLEDLYDDVHQAISRIETYHAPKQLDKKDYNVYTSLLIALAEIATCINNTYNGE